MAAPPSEKSLELLERPCPRCTGQLVRLNGCGCGRPAISFCLTDSCKWVDPANRPEDTGHDRTRRA